MSALMSPLEQPLDDLLFAAYADGRADQLTEDVARLRELDKETALHNYFGYAALVLLEKK